MVQRGLPVCAIHSFPRGSADGHLFQVQGFSRQGPWKQVRVVVTIPT